MTDEELIERAKAVLRYRELSNVANAGGVAAAILTDTGNVYVGVCIDAACGIGFCAEHSAIANMITMGESRIVKAVAIGDQGNIMPPCGRCREFMLQINPANVDAEILLAPGPTMTLDELMPMRWQDQ